ncbi:glycoside hydrolase family 3 N-terminal domain-containing protein [Flavobacterium faecale]|uniref:glycoside hydrolase family 3 N-terminal domain-containing protein n=1 Tax=Flavobacterium faecale TaxID=1355330 RepID=UPI003AAB81B6
MKHFFKVPLLVIFLNFSVYNVSGQKNTYKDPKLPIESRIEHLLSQMTMEEKVNQLVSSFPKYTKGPNNTYVIDPVMMDQLKKGMGSLQYVNLPLGAEGDVRFLNQIQKYIIENSRLGIPILAVTEALHGFVGAQATSFPQAIALAGTWDTDLVNKVYTQAALEARSRGLHLAFSPLLDLARDARWGRMDETYGEDVHLVSQIGLAAINGLQGGGETVGKNHIVASPKHFAGYGQCEGGRNFAPTIMSDRQFREEALEPFRLAVTQSHIWGVMPSHSEVEGVPAHGNERLLNSILRKEWGFKGIVVSDYNDIERLDHLHHVVPNREEAALLALKSGVNLDQPVGSSYVLLPEALKKKPEYVKDLDERVREVLRVKFMLGLFENPYVVEKEAKKVAEDKNREALALKAAEKAIILLKNEKNLLPLDKSKLKKIALIGPNIKTTVLGGYTPAKVPAVSIFDGVTDYLKGSKVEIMYAEGCGITRGKTEAQFEIGKLPEGDIQTIPYEKERATIEAAADIAKQCEVAIVCVGDNYATTREAATLGDHRGDRANLDLVGNQNALVKAIVETGTPVVVVMMHGRSLTINYIKDKADAIVDGWYLGQQTGNAIARTLFGDNNPGGKLAVTVPRSVGQIPVYYSQKPTGTLKKYLFEDSSPLFNFGYGLSYAQFSLDAIKLSSTELKAGESVEVSVDIKNTSHVVGDEVVQVYVKDVVGTITRPVMELKAFKRVTLKAGETQTVKLTLDKSAFEMLDINFNRIIEPGEFKIFVGTSSRKEDLKELTLNMK